MPEEKWNRFAATGSVRDYLEYCSCVGKVTAEHGAFLKEDYRHGTDHSAEWDGALRHADRGI